jgi:hypothetical protein
MANKSPVLKTNVFDSPVFQTHTSSTVLHTPPSTGAQTRYALFLSLR